MPICVVLARHGYTQEEHKIGWSLLHKVTGYGVTFPKKSEEVLVREAITELDGLDEPYLRRFQAGLERLHPEQAKFLFAGLTPAIGAAAVLTMQTLIERCDRLEGAPEREATRAADHAALGTLGSRGFDKAERERIRNLVRIAQEGATLPSHASAEQAQNEADILALYQWWRDWAETARTVITRRDYRIQLGLARRKRSKKDKAEPVPPTLPAPTATDSPLGSNGTAGGPAIVS